MAKLQHLKDGEWLDHSHPPIFEQLELDDGTFRLTATAPGGDVTVMGSLAECLTPPFLLLYVLHTPRGESAPGRYQSPEISAEELHSFLGDFAPLLGGDARHDLWIHSPADDATLIWDRHNLVHAYGPLRDFTTKLRALGFTLGEPQIPVPHAHFYRAELDHLSRALLDRWTWRRTDLQPEDEQ